MRSDCKRNQSWLMTDRGQPTQLQLTVAPAVSQSEQTSYEAHFSGMVTSSRLQVECGVQTLVLLVCVAQGDGHKPTCTWEHQAREWLYVRMLLFLLLLMMDVVWLINVCRGHHELSHAGVIRGIWSDNSTDGEPYPNGTSSRVCACVSVRGRGRVCGGHRRRQVCCYVRRRCWPILAFRRATAAQEGRPLQPLSHSSW
jgi:hypothetical protein